MGQHRRLTPRSGNNLTQGAQSVHVLVPGATQVFDVRAGSVPNGVYTGSNFANVSTVGADISPHPTRKHALVKSTGSAFCQASVGSPASYLWDTAISSLGPGIESGTLSTLGGTVSTVAWGTHGWCFAQGGNTTPFLRADLFLDAAAKTTQITTSANPAGAVNAVAWSPDNRFLVAAHATTPFVTFYELDSGALTLAKFTNNPTTLPGSTGSSVAWSPDGAFCAVGNITSTPFLRVYDMRSASAAGTAGVACTISAQPGTGVNDVMFSPDGALLYVFDRTSTHALVYQRTADTTWTKSTPTYDPADNVNISAAIHPNGQWGAVGWPTTTPFAGTFIRQDTNIVDGGSLPSTPSGSSSVALWSNSMQVPGIIKRRRQAFGRR